MGGLAGLPPEAQQLIRGFGGRTFTAYTPATVRASGWAGWIENARGVVVGWVSWSGHIYRNAAAEAGRGYNVSRKDWFDLIYVGAVRR